MYRRLTIIAILIFCALFLAGNAFAGPLPKLSDKTVFLTFDADMTPYMQAEQKSGAVKKWYDPSLIEYLEKNNIPATFFVTGMFAEMYPDLVKSLAANPNFSIQNHTYDHRAFEPNCFHLPLVKTDRQKIEEIRRTQNILKSLTGDAPTYFRYPGLCHNAHDDALVVSAGLLLARGEVSSGDAYMKKPEAISANTLKELNHGRVIVFHMGTVNTPATADAVKLLVPQLKQSGYTLERI